MQYDIRTSAAQLRAAAEWASGTDEESDDVELAVDDRMLVVERGHRRMAFDTGGERGTQQYITRAPLDPIGSVSRLDRRLASAIRSLVDAAWETERCDYEASGKPAGHRFEDLRHVKSWLGTARTRRRPAKEN